MSENSHTKNDNNNLENSNVDINTESNSNYSKIEAETASEISASIVPMEETKNKFFSKKIYKHCFIGGTAIVIGVSAIWAFTHKNAQEVYVDSTKVGILSDMGVTETELFDIAINKLEAEKGTSINVNEELLLKPVHASKSEVVSTDYVLTKICDNLTYKLEATVISVNGNDVAIVPSQAEAETALEKVKNSYSKEGANILEKRFVEDIEVKQKYVNSDEISTTDNAFKTLTSNVNEEKIYEIKEKDSLWSISIENDITVDEILKANPGLTENSILQIGQKINLIVPASLVSVETVERATYGMPELKEVEIIENNSEYKTYRKVIQEGRNGEKQVTADVRKINGIEQDRKIIEEKITVPAITEKIEVGTLQEPPKKAMGSFKYPVSGRLTSGFGPRWGTRHKGIDLAAPYGTTVRASDGGTVTFAGWNSGGYGNLVIIDHGNGFITYYGHNSQVTVNPGQKVAQGEAIAKVGSTGDSTGNHVHFEIRKNGVNTNPFDYLK